MFDLIVNPKIGYFEYSPGEDRLLLSDEVVNITGLKKQHSSKDTQSFINCFQKVDRPLLQKHLSPKSTLDSKILIDCHITKESDGARTIRICLLPLSYQKARATRVIGILFDMSEYSQFESQLMLERNTAQIYFDMANVILLSLSRKGTVKAINKKGCEILGLAREDIIGKDWFSSFLPKSERKEVKGVHKKNITGDIAEVSQHTNRIVTAQGEERIVSWHNSFLKDAEGVLIYVLSAGTDITEQKMAEKALSESEEKFRYVFESGCIGNSLTLPSGEIEVNQAFCKMLGFSAEELKGMKWPDITHPDDVKHCNEQISKLIKGQRDYVSFNKRYIKKDGTILWADVHTSIRKDKKKNPLYFMTSVIDITSQKIAEQKLKRSEEKYQLLFSEMKDSFALHEIICDKNGKPIDYRFLDVNPAFEQMTGLKKQDIINKTVLEVMPKTEKYWIENYGQVALTGKPMRFENYANSLDRYYEVNAYRPAPNQFACTFKDITEEKLAKERLIKSEKRLLEAQTLAQVGNWELDLKTNMIWGSEEASRIYGISKESSLIPLQRVQKLILPEYREAVKNAHLGLVSGKKKYDVQFKIRSEKEGKIKHIHSKAVLRKDETGQNIKIEGLIQDITTQKTLEGELSYLSFHDQLTGLHNRRYFEEKQALLDSQENLPISIIMGDLNGLKIVNDSFGHAKGDEFLCAAAKVIKQACSECDVVVRHGGDEFAVLLPNTDETSAVKIINNIQNSAAKIKLENIELSISFGHATKTKKSEKLSEILTIAENEMYKHKFDLRSNMHTKTINIIMNTLFEKSPRESEHSQRVSTLSTTIAKQMHFNKDDIDRIRIAGLVHDIGKIGIDKRILNKTGPLTDEEWRAVRNHSDSGWRILSASSDFSEIANLVRAHHERWDGKGYPSGLKSYDIPLEARIISIADSYDAMTSDRPYRNRLSKEQAISELRKFAGIQFDPDIVEVLINKVLS